MKKVYTVNGSEDGIIGVATNKKRATEMANSYIDVEIDYKAVCEKLREVGISMHQDHDGTEVIIEQHILNGR